MNVTKFVVLLVIGVLCAIVTARHVEEVSKETKLGTYLPKSTIKGVEGPKGPRADASESGSTSTTGRVTAKGRKAKVYSTSGSSSTGGSQAAVNRKAAAASAGGSTGSGSTVKGSSEKKGKGKKKN